MRGGGSMPVSVILHTHTYVHSSYKPIIKLPPRKVAPLSPNSVHIGQGVGLPSQIAWGPHPSARAVGIVFIARSGNAFNGTLVFDSTKHFKYISRIHL